MIKNILHVVQKMNRGGIETFIMNLYRNIDRTKYQFDFIVHTKEKGDYDDEIMSLGGRLFHIDPRGMNIHQYKKNLVFFFESNSVNYSAVHQHVSSLTSIDVITLAKKYNIPIRIIHSHSSSTKGGWMHRILHLINKQRIGNVATDFFACSDVAAKWCFAGTKSYKYCVIIKNGIEANKFSFDISMREKIRSELKILNSDLVIGHVGRFNYVKNHSFLIDVFSSFLNYEPNAKLILIGEGELLPIIQNKVIAMGLTNSVIFLGARADVADLLCAMDIFVFPSLYEGLPLALIEAQCSGLKLYCSDTVSSEVNVTQNVDFLPLSDTPNSWANFIINDIHNIHRVDMTGLVRSSGYDISSVVGLFEQKIYGKE